jgi:hypothetical protein
VGDEELFGYKTFVSIPDDARNDVEDGGFVNEVPTLYRMPKRFDRIRTLDKQWITPSLGPARGVWKDPAMLYEDSEKYRKTISAVMREETRAIVASVMVTAKTMSDISSGLSSEVKEASHSCNVHLKRAMPSARRYLFQVSSPGGQGTHVVTVVAKDKTITDFNDADIKVACTYYGPEYHARRGGYLEGSPKGTATPPRIKDPHGKNLVCKHVYAVFGVIKDYVFDTKEPVVKPVPVEEVPVVPPEPVLEEVPPELEEETPIEEPLPLVEEDLVEPPSFEEDLQREEAKAEAEQKALAEEERKLQLEERRELEKERRINREEERREREIERRRLRDEATKRREEERAREERERLELKENRKNSVPQSELPGTKDVI